MIITSFPPPAGLNLRKSKERTWNHNDKHAVTCEEKIVYTYHNKKCSHFVTEIEECLSCPCQNGGTCIDRINEYLCICPFGYNGTHCENGKRICN